MIIDINEITDGTQIQHNICVVGSGPAGITIVRELGDAGIDVALVESGAYEYDYATQDLYEGTAPDYEPLISNRLRFFGGSSNHWAGYCRPFGAEDFSYRDWVSDINWPIAYSDIQPYMRPAWEICSFGRGDPNWSSAYWLKKFGRNPKSPFTDGPFEFAMSQRSIAGPDERNARNKGISFATHYGDEIKASRFIHTYLNANVTEILTNDDGSHVKFLKVKTLAGRQYQINARLFVLACGGIENPRLLLASNRKNADGVANSSGVVGKYFTDHLIVEAGRLLISGTAYQRTGIDDLRGHFRISNASKRRNGLTNGIFSLIPQRDPRYDIAKNSKGVRAFRNLPETWRKKSITDITLDVANIIVDFDDIAARVYAKTFPNSIPIRNYSISLKLEMESTPFNRVTLSDQIDSLGKPGTNLRFRISDNDIHTISKTMELFGQQVGRLGYGRLQLLVSDRQTFEKSLYKFGHHHIGTTRMSNDHSQGVTDKNCRAHDVDNLFIAGSSVFTTGGSGTPTLMLVTLALRLGAHLKSISTHS